MKVWLICDDFYHPGWVPADGLKPLCEKGLELTVTMDTADFQAEDMGNYPVIILSKSDNISAANRGSWLTAAIRQKFVEYVEAGGGLLVTHSGLAGYGAEDVLADLIGCHFTGHPEQCPVTTTLLKPHPVTQGVLAYTEKDEHYFIDINAPDADIFMATSSASGVQAGGYTRTRGNGRICVLTPGHNVEVWLNAQHQTLLHNAIQWCAGK